MEASTPNILSTTIPFMADIKYKPPAKDPRRMVSQKATISLTHREDDGFNLWVIDYDGKASCIHLSEETAGRIAGFIDHRTGVI